MLKVGFLVKIIRISSECLRFTTIKMKTCSPMQAMKRLLYFGSFLVLIAHCSYPVPFSS